MKRIAVIALLLVFCFSLTLVSASGAEKQIVIGVAYPAADHGWTAGIGYYAQITKTRLEGAYPNLKFVLATCADSSEQANDVQDLVSINKIDALVILPFESDPLTDPVEQVRQKGVYIAVADRGLSRPVYDLFVTGDNTTVGTVSAKYFQDKLGGQKAKIVLMRGLACEADSERFDTFMEAIKGSDLEVLDWKYANWNRDKGFEVMQDYLIRFPEIDAVWSADDDVTLGVLAAIEQAKRTDIQFILGCGGMKQIVKRIMDGDELTPATVVYTPGSLAVAMELTALHYVSSAPVEGVYKLDSILCTQENAARYYFPDTPY